MCLVSYTPAETSNKKITVFKVLLDYGWKLTTPYMHTLIGKDKVLKAKRPFSIANYYHCMKVVEEEGVHAYSSLKAAIKDWEDFNGIFENTNITPVIYEAIIPPNTPYWIGVEGDIASTELLIREQIKIPLTQLCV